MAIYVNFLTVAICQSLYNSREIVKGGQMATVQEMRQPVTTGVGPAVFTARAIYFVFGIIIGFIAIRMALLLLAANPANGFVDFIYSVSALFAAPFFGMFSYTPAYGASVFEVSSVVAILVYILICWGLVTLVTLGSSKTTEV